MIEPIVITPSQIPSTPWLLTASHFCLRKPLPTRMLPLFLSMSLPEQLNTARESTTELVHLMNISWVSPISLGLFRHHANSAKENKQLFSRAYTLQDRSYLKCMYSCALKKNQQAQALLFVGSSPVTGWIIILPPLLSFRISMPPPLFTALWDGLAHSLRAKKTP